MAEKGGEGMEANKDITIKLLAIQYIKDQHYDSAAEYVRLFRTAEQEIRAAYEATEEKFNPDPLIS
jgi:hypothetical protein